MKDLKHKVLREFVQECEDINLDKIKIRDADMSTFIIYYIDYTGNIDKGIHESWVYKTKEERDEDFLTIKKATT